LSVAVVAAVAGATTIKTLPVILPQNVLCPGLSLPQIEANNNTDDRRVVCACMCNHPNLYVAYTWFIDYI